MIKYAVVVTACSVSISGSRYSTRHYFVVTAPVLMYCNHIVVKSSNKHASHVLVPLYSRDCMAHMCTRIYTVNLPCKRSLLWKSTYKVETFDVKITKMTLMFINPKILNSIPLTHILYKKT